MLEKYDTKLEDKETVINYCPYHMGDWAEVYTTDKVVMKRFEKFIARYPQCGKLIAEDKYSMTFSVHPKSASIYPKPVRKLIMSEEQRKAIGDKLNKRT